MVLQRGRERYTKGAPSTWTARAHWRSLEQSYSTRRRPGVLDPQMMESEQLKWGYLLTKAPFIHEYAYMQVL